MTEDEMVGWHHQLNGREFEQTQGDGRGQRSLVCCSPWGRRVEHNLATEQQQKQHPTSRPGLIMIPLNSSKLSIIGSNSEPKKN